MRRATAIWLTAIVLLAACAPAQRAAMPEQAAGADGAQSAPRAAFKRAVAGVPAVHASLQSRTAGPGRPRGYESLEPMVSAGLSNYDDRGLLRPQLAQAVPTLDNGLWRLLPEGRMEMSWTIRDGAAWHDGTPVTSSDLL